MGRLSQLLTDMSCSGCVTQLSDVMPVRGEIRFNSHLVNILEGD